MHGRLIFLVTSFTASVVAAPVPISPESPIESPEPLMVREASGEAISPVLDTMKREILEKLDAIIQRSVPDTHLFDANDKRRIAAGGVQVIPPGVNDKRGDRDLNMLAPNEKRSGGDLNFAAAIDKRGDRGLNMATASDKRGDRDLNMATASDKRGDRDLNMATASDKRGDRDLNFAVASDKRDFEGGRVASDANDE